MTKQEQIDFIRKTTSDLQSQISYAIMHGTVPETWGEFELKLFMIQKIPLDMSNPAITQRAGSFFRDLRKMGE